ncbi:MAG: hypothetical protein QNJ31_08670 [Candidatus Caenarcaniphilales bacterium]|nr:hypothetical protein [Candidatus Caenarcaniphilales bacterium]
MKIINSLLKPQVMQSQRTRRFANGSYELMDKIQQAKTNAEAAVKINQANGGSSKQNHSK